MRKLKFVSSLDISISYSETANEDANFITHALGNYLSIYNYKHWLDRQAGCKIIQFSEDIYCQIPCIILATRDWFVRPATLLELNFLRKNDCPKLVFDYTGEFAHRCKDNFISNWVRGDFDASDQLSTSSLVTFATRIYPSLIGTI